MSNKKRRNREKSLSSKAGLELSEPISSEIVAQQAVQSNQSDKTSLSGYLKSHWWMIAVIAFLSIGALGAGLKYLDEDAKREIARRSNKGFLDNKEGQSLLSKINPFVPAPLPSPTPQLSKEYINAGGKLLAVEDVNANAVPPADLAYWRPSTGYWVVMGPGGSTQTSQAWGTSGDVPVPGDFDGDGKTDFSIFRPSANEWWVLRSSDATYSTYGFGATGDIPAPADYDGDGKTDLGMFRPSTGVWYIFQSSNSTMITPSLGTGGGFTPTPADYDGDGKADVSVWYNSNATFYTINSANNPSQSYNSVQYGASGDKPIPGDYDGDGRADQAVWRSSNQTWYYKKSSDSSSNSYQFGSSTDLPVQNDYDADGKVDMALWRPVSSPRANDAGKWIIYQSSNSTIRQEYWGTTNDIPVPAFYRR